MRKAEEGWALAGRALSVLSARDPGIYCVDVAIAPAGIVPKAKENWRCVPNELVTFAEVRKLVVYPMLLAHFIGIVHELAPGFLVGHPTGFDDAKHFAPALVTIGYVTSNAREIVDAYRGRGISVNVEANFDVRFRLQRLAIGLVASNLHPHVR